MHKSEWAIALLLADWKKESQQPYRLFRLGCFVFVNEGKMRLPRVPLRPLRLNP